MKHYQRWTFRKTLGFFALSWHISLNSSSQGSRLATHKRDKISHLLSSPQLLSLLEQSPSKEGFTFNEIKTSGLLHPLAKKAEALASVLGLGECKWNMRLSTQTCVLIAVCLIKVLPCAQGRSQNGSLILNAWRALPDSGLSLLYIEESQFSLQNKPELTQPHTWEPQVATNRYFVALYKSDVKCKLYFVNIQSTKNLNLKKIRVPRLHLDCGSMNKSRKNLLNST